jgi:2-dehydropantoate 2-reductase
MRVLVFGSGVIGQIYGGRLAQAGHDVTLLAREPAAQALAASGVTLTRGNEITHVQPRVSTEIPPGAAFDTALVTVRRDHLAAALPAIAALPAERVALMLNQDTDLDEIRARVGGQRTVFAFPGVGGRRTSAGAITYLEIPQQKTTVEHRDGIEAPVVELLRSAGFPVELCPSMADWLKTHTVFVTTVGAAILECDGDSAALAANRGRVAAMVAAVNEGFRALERHGVTVTPRALHVIFSVMPRFFAVWYWRRQLRGQVGTLGIAPHIQATRDSEFRLMHDEVRRLASESGPTPYLDHLLAATASPTS